MSRKDNVTRAFAICALALVASAGLSACTHADSAAATNTAMSATAVKEAGDLPEVVIVASRSRSSGADALSDAERSQAESRRF